MRVGNGCAGFRAAYRGITPISLILVGGFESQQAQLAAVVGDPARLQFGGEPVDVGASARRLPAILDGIDGPTLVSPAVKAYLGGRR